MKFGLVILAFYLAPFLQVDCIINATIYSEESGESETVAEMVVLSPTCGLPNTTLKFVKVRQSS